MNKIIRTNGDDLWPLVNILNEVCNGFDVISAENEEKINYEKTMALLKKIDSYETSESDSKKEIELYLNKNEIEIINTSFELVFKEIEEWEISTRIGISIPEAIEIQKKFNFK